MKKYVVKTREISQTEIDKAFLVIDEDGIIIKNRNGLSGVRATKEQLSLCTINN